MNQGNLSRLVQSSNTPELREQTIAYLAEHLGKFLKPQERVMLAFREHKEGNISYLLEQAALRIGVEPVIWGPDHRWNTLLRQTFQSRASAVIGSPLVILSLMKLKKQYNTPLPIRKVVTLGYPCLDWVIDGIAKGLDCEVGGCFSVFEEGVVAGFACGRSPGVHIRDAHYGVCIVDDCGNPLPEGTLGNVILYPKSDPSVRVELGDLGRIPVEPCDCGSSSSRLVDIQLGKNVDPDLYKLAQYLLAWTSVLDCYLEKSEAGLVIELVTFPGEKLPKLPTAAKLLIRHYNPKTDEPLWFFPGQKQGRIF